MLSWMGRAALELVGQGGLGYSFDPLLADMKDSYGDALKHLQCVLLKVTMNSIAANDHDSGPHYPEDLSGEYSLRTIPYLDQLPSVDFCQTSSRIPISE